MVVHAGHRHAARPDRFAEVAEAAQIGDVEHHDDVGAPELADALPGVIDARQVVKEEGKPGGGRSGVGDDGVDALRPEQVRQPGLAAEAIAVRIDVGGQADSLARHEHRGQGPRRGDTIGGEGERHDENLTGRADRAGGRTVGPVGRSDG